METCFDGYAYITEECLGVFRMDKPIVPAELAVQIMKHPEFPMHYPYHHYLVPAVMLTAVYRLKGEAEEALGAALEEARNRSLNVLKGFCGLYGDCGAAVGLGIFMSILTGTTPHSEETWAMTNRITAGSLMKIAEIDGPRCCKRNCFLALQYAVPFLKEALDIRLEAPEEMECTFSAMNEDCKGDACPFFRA